MFKKIGLAVTSTLLTNSLYAGSANYALTTATFADGDAGYGFSIGTNWFFYQPKELEGFGIGLATDMGYFTLGDTKNLNDDAGMLINLDLTAGFEIEDTTLYAGVGYGAGQIGSIYYKGLNYQVAAEYDFSPTSGIGVKYNHNDCDLVLVGDGDSTDLDIISVYYKYSLAKKETKNEK